MAKNIDKMQFTNSKKRDNWEQIKLKDIAVKRNKKNKDSSISTVFSNSALNGIVEQKDFFAKKIANKDNLSSYFIVEKDDFVYNPRISSMAPCGPIHRNNTNKTGLVSPLYTVFRMDPKKCSLDYFEQYFKSSCWHKYMYSIANYGARSDRMNITDSDFFNMEIDAPQLIEQEKISSILTIWDKAIELKEKLIEQKKEQKKGLMQKLLTGEVRIAGIESEWKKVRIKDIADIYLGLTYTPKYVQEGVPFLSVKDLDGNKLNFENVKYISREEYENSTSNAKPKKGDILFGRVGTLGNPVILNEDVEFCIFVSLGFLRIKNEQILNYFVKYWMESTLFLRQVEARVAGSSQRNLNTGWLKEFELLLPQIKEQKIIVNILSNIDKEISLLEQEHSLLIEQKRGLMQQLLTGKIRVQV